MRRATLDVALTATGGVALERALALLGNSSGPMRFALQHAVGVARCAVQQFLRRGGPGVLSLVLIGRSLFCRMLWHVAVSSWGCTFVDTVCVWSLARRCRTQCSRSNAASKLRRLSCGSDRRPCPRFPLMHVRNACHVSAHTSLFQLVRPR